MEFGLRGAMPPGFVWLGWTFYDMPSYYANAREVFENGTGFTYGNPYSLQAHPPRIYSNLQILAMGWLWRAGIPARAQEIAWRIGGAAAAFGLLAWIVAAWIPARSAGTGAGSEPEPGAGAWGGRWRLWAWLAAMLGGGATILPAIFLAAAGGGAGADSAAHSGAGFFSLLASAHRQLEGRWGWWFLNTGRNLLYTTELFYHALFFGTVLAFLAGRARLGFALFLITWWAHPFTALHLGIILGAWFALEWALACRKPEWADGAPEDALFAKPNAPRRILLLFAAIAAIQIAFMLYYGPFMSHFAEHRELVKIWTGPEARARSVAPLWHVFLSYGPLLAGLAWVAGRNGRAALRRSPRHRLLLVWAAATFLLMHQDKIPFVRNPVQPLHFSRGYLHLALVIWTALLLRDWEIELRGGRAARAAGIALLALLAADNFVFWGRYFADGEALSAGILATTEADMAMMRRLGEITPAGQRVLTIEPHPARGLGYLLNTYTPQRSFIGHGANTPGLRERLDAWRAWTRNPDPHFFDTWGITAIAARLDALGAFEWPEAAGNPVQYLDKLLDSSWRRVDAPAGYALWIRETPPSP